MSIRIERREVIGTYDVTLSVEGDVASEVMEAMSLLIQAHRQDFTEPDSVTAHPLVEDHY